jgi:hypothetical protein
MTAPFEEVCQELFRLIDQNSEEAKTEEYFQHNSRDVFLNQLN